MELNDTIRSYFHQPSLASVGVQELQKAMHQHPYCALFQFLLLKKQFGDQDPAFADQLKTTQLYFTNPYWLQVCIDRQEAKEEKQTTTGLEAAEPFSVPVAKSGEPAGSSTTDSPQEAPANPGTELPSNPGTELLSHQPSNGEQETIPGFLNTPQEANAATGGDTILSESEEDGPGDAQPITGVNNKIEAESAGSRADILFKESPIPIPSLKDISPRADDQPIFEPYHTIDYFASLGIKLSSEVPANDRLGRQLRSFTEWIRTMKKLPQTDLERQIGEPGVGDKIAAMAAGSVVRREILTETMAEVLVKQGNLEKAIELYRKLSLAYPDKSAYFAARIDQLKRS